MRNGDTNLPPFTITAKIIPIRSIFYANIVNSGIIVQCELITCIIRLRIGECGKYERYITIFQSVGYYNTLISQS